MATASLPVPVEILESVLRFVPVNEAFRADSKSANEIARMESRDHRFRSVRLNKFWRLQFVYKQWMEIVQLRLGEFELKLSVSASAPTTDCEERAMIWNQFVAFNLSKQSSLNSLDILSTAYLNCYISVVKLFYEIPAYISCGTALNCLTRIFKRISTLFPDQNLSIELCVAIRYAMQDRLLADGRGKVVLPSALKLTRVSVVGYGPYPKLVRKLLVAAGQSISYFEADIRFLTAELSKRVFPSISTLRLTSSNPPLASSAMIGRPFPPVAIATAFPNVVSLVIPGQALFHLFVYVVVPIPGNPGPFDLRPLLRLRLLSNLEFTAPRDLSQTNMNIEHAQIKMLRMRVLPGANGVFDQSQNCLKWLRVAGGPLEELELSGLGYFQLWQLAQQIQALSGRSVDFSQLRTVRLSVSNSDSSNEELHVGIGLAVAFEKFQQHFPSLRSLSLEVNPREVPQHFGRFALQNAPGHVTRLRLINAFQNDTGLKIWKTWVLDMLSLVASLSKASEVEIISTPACFVGGFSGLAEFCHSLAAEAKRAYFDYAAYFGSSNAPAISHVIVSKTASVANDSANSIRREYDIEFWLNDRNDASAPGSTGSPGLAVVFRFKEVL